MTGRSRDQDLIDKLLAQISVPDAPRAQTNGHGSSRPPTTGPSDAQVIEKCCAAKNAAKFEALFDRGDTSAHGGDDSRADLGLLSLLAFWTQEEAQLERIFSSSALGRREKWRRRDDYRKRTIRKVFADLGEVYDWSKESGRSRPLRQAGDTAAGGGGLADSPYIGKSTKSAGDEGPALRLVRFAGRPVPSAREFVIPGLIPRYHPTTLYGWGGTAKSLIAVLLAMCVAAGRKKFFDRDVAVHGPVLYLDFELDADEQHRRVVQLAAGLGIEVPEDLLYVSALGVRTHEAIGYALTVCEEHGVVLAVLDSLGPAMVGDMAAARDVIEFHNCYIAPFREAGTTTLLVDHQARQQAGEGYQSKGAFGSAYKEHLSRSLIQVEAGDRSSAAEHGTLNVRLRHKKTNFGALCDPFDVSLTFSDEMISASVKELTSTDRAQEATLNARDRVLAALEDGPAYPDELVETTGLARSTVKNQVNNLKKAGRVEATGEARGQMEEVRLADSRTRPIKEKSAKSTDSTPESPGPPTVAGLFADPPDWLCKQLEVYREDPGRHLRPLCATVAAVVLEDGTRGHEVREEVERELAGRGAG
ncbi:MAG: AAA family ATPase [Actinomycetota bacterium]|nr:AAA family ATPase [Actinomycetota bacterium]